MIGDGCKHRFVLLIGLFFVLRCDGKKTLISKKVVSLYLIRAV